MIDIDWIFIFNAVGSFYKIAVAIVVFYALAFGGLVVAGVVVVFVFRAVCKYLGIGVEEKKHNGGKVR